MCVSGQVLTSSLNLIGFVLCVFDKGLRQRHNALSEENRLARASAAG